MRDRFDETAVRKAMAELIGVPVERCADGAELGHLVPSSMALVELVIRLQEALQIRLVQADLQGVKTVGDLLRVLHDRATAQRAA